MTYINRKQRAELDYKVRDKVYLKTKDLYLYIKQKGYNVKFYTQFMGLFEVIKVKSMTSNFAFKLPLEFHIYLKVHIE